MLLDEVGREYVFHVAGIEKGIIETIKSRIGLGIFDSLGYILYTYNLTHLAGYEVGYRTGTGVEVIDQIVAGESGKIGSHLVQLIGLGRVGLIKRLGPYLEVQTVHLFENVVTSTEGMHFAVGNRIIGLGVDDIKKRGYLRKFPGNKTHQGFDAGSIVFVKDHNEHDFARRSRAHNDIAHETGLLAQIEERIVVINSKLFDSQPYAIGDIVLQPALLDVKHLIKHTGNVESQGIAVGIFLGRSQLLRRKPRFVGEGKFELVTIELGAGRPFDGIELGQGYFSDAGQIVEYLFLLELQLTVIGNMLKLAAATHAEMFAKRRHTHGRSLVHTHDATFGIFMFLAVYLYIDNIARRSVGNKNDQVVYPRHRLSFCGNIGYLHLLQDRKFFLFTSQNKQFLNKYKFGQR